MRVLVTLVTLSLASPGRGAEVRRRQEEISRAFYQRLGQLADRAEQGESEGRAGSGRNYGGFAPWQSAFSAANDAYKVFQRYETLRNIQKKKPETTKNDRTRSFVDNQKKKNQFIAFEAVPNVVSSEIEKELSVKIELIKEEPVVEYIPFDSNLFKKSQPSSQIVWNLTSPTTLRITTTPRSTTVETTTPLITTTRRSTTVSTTTTSTTTTTTSSPTTTMTSSTTTTRLITPAATSTTITTMTKSTTNSTATTTKSSSTTNRIRSTTTSTTTTTIKDITSSTDTNDPKLDELLSEIFVSSDPNPNELLDEIFVPTKTSTSTTISTRTAIDTTTATTTQKPRYLVDLILSNVFKLTSDLNVDPSNQTTNLWELAENYVLTSTTSTTTYTSPFTTTTMKTTKEITTTKTTSTTTTSTTSTSTPRKDHSISSPNQKTKGRIDSRGFPVKVVTDPHGLEFYFPDVLNLLFGSV